MAIDKKLIDQLLTDYQKPEDIIGENGLLKQLTKALLERALEAEMTDHLGYEKHDAAGHHRGNTRNGKSRKNLNGDFGQLELETPRDRKATFEPKIVAKGQTRWTGFDGVVDCSVHDCTQPSCLFNVTRQRQLCPPSWRAGLFRRVLVDGIGYHQPAGENKNGGGERMKGWPGVRTEVCRTAVSRALASLRRKTNMQVCRYRSGRRKQNQWLPRNCGSGRSARTKR